MVKVVVDSQFGKLYFTIRHGSKRIGQIVENPHVLDGVARCNLYRIAGFRLDTTCIVWQDMIQMGWLLAGWKSLAKVQIDYRLRYAHMRTRTAHSVRGCLLAAIMILELRLQDAYISVICKTSMHVIFKWSAASSLAGVLVGRAKRGCFVHTWILCGTCVVIMHGS